MADTTRLAAALADRYRLERELGQGGRLQREKQLPVDEAVRIAREVADR